MIAITVSEVPVLLLDSVGNHLVYVARNMQGINGISEQIDSVNAGYCRAEQ